MKKIEIFPKLTPGTRLEHLDWTTAAEYRDKLRTMVVPVLAKHGPLPLEGIAFFFEKEYGFAVYQGDLRDAYLDDNAEIMFDPFKHHDACYRTMQQHADGMAPVIPAPRDYAAAYYQLHERIGVYRQHPDLLQTPNGLLEDLGL